MDYDSMSFDLAGPKSQRISDVRDAYQALTHRGLQIMAERISEDPVYTSNENGHFAWGVSLAIRAACLAWSVTSNSVHLQQAARWAQHMVERTDEARGFANYRSERGPAWSAGSRYTAGSAVVGNIGGAPIRLQAAAESVIIERPSDTTAIIRTTRKDGSTWSSPEASLLPENDNYLPDVLAQRSAAFSVLLRGLPAPVDLTSLRPGLHALESHHATHLVHTGLVARSLISVAEALESGAKQATDIGPDDLYGAARRALFHHDDEIRTRSGQSWYITPEDFPGRRLGLELPHNHVADAATSFLILGQKHKDEGLRSLGRSLTQSHLGEIKAYEAGNLRHPWVYYPLDSDTYLGVTRDEPTAERRIPAVQRSEDSSHATMRARSIVEWKTIDPRTVPDEALSAIALAFRRHYMTAKNGVPTLRWLPEDRANANRQGSADTYPGAWGALAPWDSTIQRRVNSIAYWHPPQSVFGATVLSSAEIFALNAGVSTYASLGQNAQA